MVVIFWRIERGMKKKIKILQDTIKSLTLMILIWVICRMLFKMENVHNVICNIFFITIYTLTIMFRQEKELHSFWKKSYEELYDMTTNMYQEIIDKVDEQKRTEREDNKNEQIKISINSDNRNNSN